MSFGFNPFDSDTFPEPDPLLFDDQEIPVDTKNEVHSEPNLLPPFIQQSVQLVDEYSEEEDEEPHFATDPSENSIHMCGCSNLKTVVSVLTGYDGGNLTKHLQGVPGLIILPLDAVTMIRRPTGNHKNDPKIILYVPKGPEEEYSHMGNFNEAIKLLNQ